MLPGLHSAASNAAVARTFFFVAVVFLGLGAAAFLGLGAAAFLGLGAAAFLTGVCVMQACQHLRSHSHPVLHVL